MQSHGGEGGADGELPALDAVHILDGDPGNPKLGGHRAGTGRSGKTEFPVSWSDQDVISAVETAMRRPEVFIHGGDRVDYLGEVNSVVIRVSTYMHEGIWVFRTAYPVNGTGVVQNPPDGGSAVSRPLNRKVTERYRRSMNDYVAVSNALAAAARPCFNDVDRDFVDSALGAGEYFFAVDDALAAAARENFPLPAQLVHQVRRWLDGDEGGIPAKHRDRFERLLDRVTVTPAHRSA